MCLILYLLTTPSKWENNLNTSNFKLLLIENFMEQNVKE